METRPRFAAVAAAAAFAVAPYAQEQPPVFRVGSELVVIDLIATDRAGRFVADLQPGEIQILEDGKPQKVQFLRLLAAPRRCVPQTPPGRHPRPRRPRQLRPIQARLKFASRSSSTWEACRPKRSPSFGARSSRCCKPLEGRDVALRLSGDRLAEIRSSDGVGVRLETPAPPAGTYRLAIVARDSGGWIAVRRTGVVINP